MKSLLCPDASIHRLAVTFLLEETLTWIHFVAALGQLPGNSWGRSSLRPFPLPAAEH